MEEGAFRDDHFVCGRVEFPGAASSTRAAGASRHPNGQGRLVIDGRDFEGVWANGCLRSAPGWFAFTRPARECEGAPPDAARRQRRAISAARSGG